MQDHANNFKKKQEAMQAQGVRQIDFQKVPLTKKTFTLAAASKNRFAECERNSFLFFCMKKYCEHGK